MTKRDLKCWLFVLWDNIEFNRLFDSAAVLSFYFLLALFPAIAVLLAITSYLPIELIGQGGALWWVQQLPIEISSLVNEVIGEVKGQRTGGILSLGVLTALWTASSGIVATIRQMNVAYQASEERSFLKLRIVSVLLTLGLVAFSFVPIVVLLAVHLFSIFLPGPEETLVAGFFNLPFVKYIVLGLLLALVYSIIYYFGPCVKQKFKSTIPGSLFAAATLVALTKLFEIYMEEVAAYESIYGGLGGVIIFMLWLYLLGLLIILGAELNFSIQQCYIQPMDESKR